MDIKKSIASQYYASLEMLKQAVEACPEELWYDTGYTNPFWRTAFHALYYTHLYLQPTEQDFIPWQGLDEQYRVLGSSPDLEEMVEPLSKESIAAYIAFCHQEVEKQVAALDPSAESGFSWIPLDKFEHQLYSIRHIMQHTGELFERLGESGGPELHWVGGKPEETS